MAFIPSADAHKISLEEAVDMTKRYREHKETILKTEYQGKDILCLSETFNKEELLRYFSKPEIYGIRIYYGMDATLKTHAILVGVDQEGKDILPVAKNIQVNQEEEPLIFEDGKRCPPECSLSSVLNS